MTGRNSKEDVVRAAGRLFADRGYHGTSMRALGKELGLLGSSLYSHVGGKQDLLVEVVERGAHLFEQSVAKAWGDSGAERLQALVAGHVEVMLDNRDEVRTFLYEAEELDDHHRAKVIDARDRYERVFREAIAAGMKDHSLRPGLDPKLDAIFVLSILNAIDRWFHEPGALSRKALIRRINAFVMEALADKADN